MGKRELTVADVMERSRAMKSVSRLNDRVDVFNQKQQWEIVTRLTDEQLKIVRHESVGKPVRRVRKRVRQAESFIESVFERMGRGEHLTAVDQHRADKILADLNNAWQGVKLWIYQQSISTQATWPTIETGSPPGDLCHLTVISAITNSDPPTNLATLHRDINLGHVAGSLPQAYQLTA